MEFIAVINAMSAFMATAEASRNRQSNAASCTGSENLLPEAPQQVAVANILLGFSVILFVGLQVVPGRVLLTLWSYGGRSLFAQWKSYSRPESATMLA